MLLEWSSASPLLVDCNGLCMLVSCQKSHDWVVLLQICIPIDDNRLVPPAVLLPGDVIGVLRVVLLKKRTFIYSTFVDNRMGFGVIDTLQRTRECCLPARLGHSLQA